MTREPIALKILRWLLIALAFVFLSPVYFAVSWWRPPCSDRRRKPASKFPPGYGYPSTDDWQRINASNGRP